MATHNLVPAYGRDYHSRVEILADFHDNKDFIISEFGNRWDGKAINKQQMLTGDAVRVRYGNLRQVFEFTFTDEPFDLFSEMSMEQKRGLLAVRDLRRPSARAKLTLQALRLMTRTGELTPLGVEMLKKFEAQLSKDERLAGQIG